LLLTNAKVDLLVDRSEEEEEERKRMSVTSDDVNLLVYRYLVESGFVHTAFSFAAESALAKTSVAASDVPQVRSAAARGLFASSRPHAAAHLCARAIAGRSHHLLAEGIAVHRSRNSHHRREPTTKTDKKFVFFFFFLFGFD
jgi:hypothetical protein